MSTSPDFSRSELRSLNPLEVITLFRRWHTSIVHDIILGAQIGAGILCIEFSDTGGGAIDSSGASRASAK